MNERTFFRGWAHPGPTPPGGVDVEEGETLDHLAGRWRIFQYRDGHRFSTDDVLCASYASQWAPRVERYCDLGSGIGSVALTVAWRLPGCHVVTVEAQERSLRLLQKSVRYNGVAHRFTPLLGDLRDPAVFEGQGLFDLVTGSPPYWAVGAALPAGHPQAVGARLETRGAVDDYAKTAARILAPGGVFACVFQAVHDDKVRAALVEADLVLLRTRPVCFKEGVPAERSGLRLYLAAATVDLPPGFPDRAVEEPPLTIRSRNGSIDPEYSALKMSFGFPPG
ncbi:MAG: tRNA1(Val) (adenine(37)-N6)-methyltransferase [Myxococcota bacterium]